MAEVPISVSCDEDPDGGWRCAVVVGVDAGATHHEVEVAAATRDELAADADPEALVRASFMFLLEREARESIMATFELPVIGRYFSGYRDEIRRRLRRGDAEDGR